MSDAKNYALSKILSIIQRSNPHVVLIDSDLESDSSALLGQEGFGEDKSLSSDTIEEHCKIHDTKTVLLQIVGVHGHHPYGIGLSNRYPH